MIMTKWFEEEFLPNFEEMFIKYGNKIYLTKKQCDICEDNMMSVDYTIKIFGCDTTLRFYNAKEFIFVNEQSVVTFGNKRYFGSLYKMNEEDSQNCIKYLVENNIPILR